MCAVVPAFRYLTNRIIWRSRCNTMRYSGSCILSTYALLHRYPNFLDIMSDVDARTKTSNLVIIEQWCAKPNYFNIRLGKIMVSKMYNRKIKLIISKGICAPYFFWKSLWHKCSLTFYKVKIVPVVSPLVDLVKHRSCLDLNMERKGHFQWVRSRVAFSVDLKGSLMI